jgi:riboflavin synthase
MFTGIIKEVGKLKTIHAMDTGLEFEIESSFVAKEAEIGDSICVNGCCLTVKGLSGQAFQCDLSYATLKSTNFANVRQGAYLNLEDALRVGDKLGGHFVSGHVDGVLKIKKISKIGDFYKLEIYNEPEIACFIAPKGSIAIDGISLTIADVNEDVCSVAVIGHTFFNTNLQYRKNEHTVNAEIDLLARYIFNILNSAKDKEPNKKDHKLKEILDKHGFTKKTY